MGQERVPTDGKTHLVTNQACFACAIARGRISKIDETHFSVQNKPQDWGASAGLQYEAAWALGAANGVRDLEALQYANLICNEHGMDPISFGATVGAVMELYELGVLTKAQIGLEAPFGSARALCELADMTANGIGFGKEIGLGSKRPCEKYGHPELSMSVKGQEFPAYDSPGRLRMRARSCNAPRLARACCSWGPASLAASSWKRSSSAACS